MTPDVEQRVREIEERCEKATPGPCAEGEGMSYKKWCKQVDRIGIKEGIFDKPSTQLVCPGSHLRRPAFTDPDSLWRILYDSGLPPQMAIGEALVEQDCEP